MAELNVTLPDGSRRVFPEGATALDVARGISPRLADAAFAAKIDGRLRDVYLPLPGDCHIEIVTNRCADALDIYRHSCAHLMANAVKELFPEAKIAIGPTIENGFYYDFDRPEPFQPEDLAKIEERMEEIISRDTPIRREEMPWEKARDLFEKEGEPYKAELAFERGQNEPVSIYRQGQFNDFCRGPHLPSTGKIKPGTFKLLSVAGAYWKGDEHNKMLQRIYATAFLSAKELEEHLARLEEAKLRDHRKLGKELKLFHIDEDVGPGLILWTPAGATIRQELQNFISEELRKQGYAQVFTPHIGKLTLYKTSGHFPYYKDSQFPAIVAPESLAVALEENCSCAELMNRVEAASARLAASVNERAGREVIGAGQVMPDDQLLDGFLLKPMNCPHHIKIFSSQPHSYRDLPVRLAEFGTVYRWEQSGELNGMTRVRGFTQDDAHLFCTEDQVGAEVRGCLSLVKIIFGTLGLADYRVRVGLRDPDSKKYTGTADNWDKAEEACRDAARTLGVPFTEEPGEAAFYGPKIDFIIRDVIGREWQLGTVQVDYNLPIRFDLTYTGADNAMHRPVMIHRAPFGSMERFVGILIEHFKGAFPLWLAPEQVRLLPIADRHVSYCNTVAENYRAAGLRVSVDSRPEKTGYKIREAQLQKVPYMLVAGDREVDAGAVSVRALKGGDLGVRPSGEFLETLRGRVAKRTLELE
ncbi:MAG: threonine--tRNA ligase [Acidobacteria bacterium]|nr:threonine--tRNA ligase [Acidobacteriota bacterium]